MIKLWCEGFQVQEGTSGAWKLGTYHVDTLLEAAKMYKESIKDPSLVDLDKMTYWGCRLFDNKKDAQKLFG